MMAAKLIRVDDAINRWDSVSHMDQHRDPLEIKRTLGGLQIARKHGQVRCPSLLKPIHVFSFHATSVISFSTCSSKLTRAH